MGYTVYKHTNLKNNKVYIGITSRKPETRWNKGKNYSGNLHFYNAIQKYGWDGFSHDILFENLSEDEAKETEIKLIKEYNSTNPDFGYNLTPGGDLNPSIFRKKVYIYDLDGNFVQEFDSIIEAEETLSISHVHLCCTGKLNRVGNYQASFEKKDFLDRYVPAETPLNFYSLTGEYLFTIKTIREASRKTGIHSFNLMECAKLNPEHLRAGNYLVRFLSEEFPVDKNLNFNYFEIKENNKKNRKKPVKIERDHSKEILQFDLDNNFIKEWPSVTSAQDSLKIYHINDVANGLRKSAGNFIWKWKF